MAVQNITLKYVLDTTDLTKAEKSLHDLNEEEKQLATNFDKVNDEAKKAGTTIKNEADKSKAAVDKVGTSTTNLSSKFSSLKNVITSGFSIDSIQAFSGEMTNLGTSVGKTSGVFNILKIAIASTGIGLLVIALGSLVVYFTQTEEGGDKLAKVMSVLRVVFGALLNVITDLGSWIADKFTSYIEGLVFVLETLANLTVIVIRDLASLAEKVGLDKLSEGLNTVADSAEGAIISFKNMTAEAIALGAAIADLEDELEALASVIKVQNAELETIIDRNLRALRNRNLTYKEGMQLIKEVGAAEQQILQNNIGFNNKEIELWQNKQLLIVKNKDAFKELNAQYNNGTISGLEYVKMLNEFINKEADAGGVMQDQVDELSSLLVKREDYVRQSAVLNERLNNLETAFQLRRQQEREKEFQDQLKHLNELEKIIIRRMQLEGASEDMITLFKRQSLESRIQLFQQYGKQETIEYQNLLLDRQALDQEYSRQLDKQQQARLDKEKEIWAERIAAQRAAMGEEVNIALIGIQTIQDKEKEAAQKKIELQKQVNSQLETLFEESAKAFFAIRANQLNYELNTINAKKNAEIAAAGDSQQAIAIINQKYDREAAAIKRKQAVLQKQQAVFNILLSGGEGAAKTIASVGLPAAFPLLGIQAGILAAQLAVVASQKIPQFNKGTRSVPGHDTGKDSVLAMLRPGEAVVPVAQNKMSSKLIDGIISGRINDSVLSMNYSVMAKEIGGFERSNNIEKKLDQLNNTLANLPIAHVEMDKKGLRSFLRSDKSSVEILNNYFKN